MVYLGLAVWALLLVILAAGIILVLRRPVSPGMASVDPIVRNNDACRQVVHHRREWRGGLPAVSPHPTMTPIVIDIDPMERFRSDRIVSRQERQRRQAAKAER